MVRAFTRVFPQSVLLSGMQAELLLVGTTAPTIEIDPDRIAEALAREPAVRRDAAAIDLGTPTEIVGTFVGSAETLARATRGSPSVADDRPLQEYGVSSVVGTGLRGVPASLFELTAVDRWCPRCLRGNDLVPAVAGLDTYLALLDEAYHAPVAAIAAAASKRAAASRRILGSAYLGAVVPDSPRANALVADAEYDLGSQFLERGDYRQAAEHLLAAIQANPESAAAHNDLGVALASSGALDQALEHFRRAVALEPDFTQARNNLTAALRSQRR
jgi:tetratricopeptide (TPR) repeat protein